MKKIIFCLLGKCKKCYWCFKKECLQDECRFLSWEDARKEYENKVKEK